jgi:CDGSH-type Zn-finger protein
MADPVVIRCRENGPFVIQAPIKVVDHLGNEYPLNPGKETYALCRCGHSKNKPFCDGTHRECGFQGGPLAPAAAAPATPPPITPA